MELLMIITLLCICLSSTLLTSCASLQIGLQQWEGQVHDHDLISVHLRDAYNQQQHSFSKMPRKLRLIQAKRDGEKDSITQHHMQKGELPGKINDKEQGLRHGRRRRSGTMQEWMEGADMSDQFFTMDYSQVRRRRPIHNKSLPGGRRVEPCCLQVLLSPTPWDQHDQTLASCIDIRQFNYNSIRMCDFHFPFCALPSGQRCGQYQTPTFRNGFSQTSSLFVYDRLQ